MSASPTSDAWDASHAAAVHWRSGPWSCELRDDELAEIRYDGRRVLRSVRAVVRDRDWNTAAWTIDGVDLIDGADATDGGTAALAVRLHTGSLGADISGEVRVEASGNSLTIAFDAVSHAAFETNRTGLVVLHPPQAAGAALDVTHTDTGVERTRLPVQIAPHQPVVDIAALRWIDDGVDIDVSFAGDVFEMEDQRNWTDASFKTYSRPLALPFPYALAAGECVRQEVTITVHEVAARADASDAEAPARLVLAESGLFPEIGVGASTAPDPAPTVPSAIGEVLLVEVDLASPTWRAALQRAAQSGCGLDVRLVLADDDREVLAEAVAVLAMHPLVRIAAFRPTGPARHVSDSEATAQLRSALADAGVDVAVVGGVRSHFTELNREHHRLPRDLEGFAFAVTPLFHSLGTEQLVESLEMQRLVAAQAVRISAHLAGEAFPVPPVHIGPISVRPHFNDVATTPPPVSAHSDLRDGYGPELIDAADDRQRSRELAAWTIASAAALAVPGVASLSYFEEWGPRGIRSSDGAAYPVAAALDALAALRGGTLLHGDSPDGLVWAIGSRTDAAADTPTMRATGTTGTTTVLVANLADVARSVTVEAPGLARPNAVTVAARSFAALSL